MWRGRVLGVYPLYHLRTSFKLARSPSYRYFYYFGITVVSIICLPFRTNTNNVPQNTRYSPSMRSSILEFAHFKNCCFISFSLRCLPSIHASLAICRYSFCFFTRCCIRVIAWSVIIYRFLSIIWVYYTIIHTSSQPTVWARGGVI